MVAVMASCAMTMFAPPQLKTRSNMQLTILHAFRPVKLGLTDSAKLRHGVVQVISCLGGTFVDVTELPTGWSHNVPDVQKATSQYKEMMWFALGRVPSTDLLQQKTQMQ